MNIIVDKDLASLKPPKLSGSKRSELCALALCRSQDKIRKGREIGFHPNRANRLPNTAAITGFLEGARDSNGISELPPNTAAFTLKNQLN